MYKKNTIRLSVDCESTPQELWPYLADFNVLGQYLNAPHIDAEDRQFGYFCSLKNEGTQTQTWLEHPPQWIKNYWWKRLRVDYKNSHFLMTCEEIQCDPFDDKTQVHYMLSYLAKSQYAALLLKGIYLPIQLRRIKKCFKQIDDYVARNRNNKSLEQISQNTTLESFCQKLDETPYKNITLADFCKETNMSYELAEKTLVDMQRKKLLNLVIKGQCGFCRVAHRLYDEITDVPEDWVCRICGEKTSQMDNSNPLDVLVRSQNNNKIYAPFSPSEASRNVLAHISLEANDEINAPNISLTEKLIIRVDKGKALQQVVELNPLAHGLWIELHENRLRIKRNDSVKTLCIENLKDRVSTVTILDGSEISA